MLNLILYLYFILSHLFNVKISLNFTYITPYFPTLSTPNFHQKFTIFTPNFETPIYTIVAPASLEKLFDSNGSTNFDKLSSVAFNNIDTSEVTNMSYMFRLCTSLSSITGLSNFDTSNVTTMRCMFENVKVTSLDLSNFNTSKVTDIAYMFKNCSNLTSLNVSSFNTSLVTTMQETMRGLTSYTGTLDLSKWKIKKSCNMGDFMVDSTKISTFYTPCRIASSQDTTIGIRMKANYYDNYNSSNVNSGSLFYPDTVTHRLTKR